MTRHRTPGAAHPNPEVARALSSAHRADPKAPRPKQHRAPAPPSRLRTGVVLAAVATGAAIGAAQGQDGSPRDSQRYELAAQHSAATMDINGVELTGMGGDAPAMELLPTSANAKQAEDEVASIDKSKQLAKAKAEEEERKRREEEEARRPKFFAPTYGRFTSGYGARWGRTHYGIDIANKIGTPIYAVTDGTVISAGPASGFGLWVRILHEDGTISVYGHVDRYLVRVGQKVKAGQQIATMGNRGQSTGPHLHFEVIVGGKKINPLPWLAARGITVG